MLTRRACALALASALGLLAGAPLVEAQSAPLAGYAELTVEVAGLPSQAHEARVERSDLKAQMDRVLRRAGVRVLTRDDMPESVGPVPVLMLTLHMVRTPSLDGVTFAYHMRVACTRPATTPENQRQVTGVLWERERMGTTQRQLIRSRLADDVDALLDGFLNDWRAANPRQP